MGLPEIGRELLSRLADGRGFKRIHLSVKDGAFVQDYE